MESSAEAAGRVSVYVLTAVLAVYFLVRAMGNVPRSRRLANLALCCGLLGLARPLVVAHVPALALHVALVALGGAGLVLAGMALAHRRDGGSGIIRGVLGLLLGIATLAAGVVPLTILSSTREHDPWVYRASDSSYRLTLPSEHWKMTRLENPGKLPRVVFYRDQPKMQIFLALVAVDQTEEQFHMLSDATKETIQREPEVRSTMRDGVNAAGHAYRYFTATSPASGDGVFFAASFTWIPAKHRVVQLVFEGKEELLADESREAERAAFAQQAEAILLSVQ